MAQKYQVGDAAYIVESNRFIRKVKITKEMREAKKQEQFELKQKKRRRNTKVIK